MSRIVVLYDPAFPMEGSREAAEEWAKAAAAFPGGDGGAEFEVAGASELADSLAGARGFVNLHAPYFPKSAWPEILAFLRAGGGLVSVGDAPFKRPVRYADGNWQAEAEQTAYHRQLHIHEELSVDSGGVVALRASEDIPLLAGAERRFAIADTRNLVPHVTKSSDHPDQMGSSGPMDTRIYPLLVGVTKDGREVTAPVVLWEHVGGPFAGGRWLFFNQPIDGDWAEAPAEAARWASFCAKGVTELWLKPNYATYRPGERASLSLQMQRIVSPGMEARRTGETAGGRGSREREKWTLSFAVGRDGEEAEWTHALPVEAGEEWEATAFSVPVEIRPGLYYAICRAEAADGEVRVLRQGFWGYDAALLSSGSPVVAGKDYFERAGRPLPVVGMTYMTSDVARKFLFLPNAGIWDRDMDRMRRAGINWIRTGIWTAYRHVMQVDGHASEEALRAIDAFLLTASKHGLHVTFTFFSFTPETWEGVNPYLDPRSLNAQKRFIRAIVSRHRDTVGVDWDLINEPSLFDPARIFSDGPRSCGDPYERSAYADWLRERHGSVETLRERWNMTPEQLPDFEAALPPESGEINFDVQDMHQGKKGTRWLDYVLFSMAMHNRWAGRLRETIKEIAPDRLVTVGQDEGLGAQRPSPFFYAEEVDYTTVHSWWLNDHLVWDGVFAKTPDKPNLVQETGIMYVETPDGRAKRTEAELRNILERKYAYAFATGGAGAVHWIWNTNFYMDNANESHIGALRADGTEKPEAEVSYDFGRFMEAVRDLFGGRPAEEIAVVYPYSNDFSNRKLAFDATTRAARVLAYELKMPFRAASEYHLDDLEKRPAKLILLPSPHNVEEAAAERLFDIVRSTGATLLWTGPIGLDAYWRPVDRLAGELGGRRPANVRREERLQVDGRSFAVSFGARRIAEVGKELRDAEDGESLAEIPLGRGRLLWCPLPVELNDRYEPVAALYRKAAETAGCSPELEWLQGGEQAGLYGRKLAFPHGALYVFVSESGEDADVAVRDPATGRRYAFRLESDRSVLFAADAGGAPVAVYRPDETGVRVD